ncbi:MAG TPA: zf-HC2 domain-containing protein [Pyrinomonadaceae bacterium]|nr:zf-HC2 domain-containing protein [Pyrinomonadaceae bacterium]
MTCEESKKAFSPHLDGALSREAGDALGEHLAVCPPCRAELEATRSLIRSLSLVSRPAPPADLAASIASALVIERAARRARPQLPLPVRILRWVEPRVMPYAVGAFYSMLLFVAVFAAIRQPMRLLRNLAEAERLEAGLPANAVWVDAGGGFDVTRPLSPELSAAAARAPFSVESPTLNPRGALAQLALTTPSSRNPDDDDMIVVADVYGNGRASLAAVVEPPRNPRMLEDLQDAFRQNPAFVPASLDRRPQTMRVVFVLQKMNVPDASY